MGHLTKIIKVDQGKVKQYTYIHTYIHAYIIYLFKDVRVHVPITSIKLGIPIYFIDHSEFISVQCKKITSRTNNEIKCFEFSSIKKALRPHLRTIIAI